ncbi:MAG: UDP-N-acetyl-D-mannosamine dehydrogenase [Deltaproteobacteria bacterium]|nr:UDP-N-acetyl-D-mannosamine dehydrogenase [Deltaproteobacteria bacterium]MBW2257550.1 UDP-N-acetyl-D-mannosamine dehydrogenase [Deltaproteobacteria bacterium]
MEPLRICVLGLGYIGLPTASLLATKGFRVLGVDVNPDVVETINRGAIHIKEPELDILVRSAVHSGNLKAATEPSEAEIFIIAVPTPFMEGHRPDLSYIEAATAALAPCLRKGDLVILESTSPVGTTDRVSMQLREARPDLVDGENATFFVTHCPERVLPGRILRELVENDRIVGGVDPPSTEAASRFYRTFVSGEVLATDARTAEMAKLVENSYRDVNIAFANELSILSHRFGINVWELIRLANHHPRVSILQPGAGVGGHCLAVDPWFIVSSAPEDARLIRTSREVNEGKTRWVVERALDRARRFRDPVVAVLGLTYKPDIDDLRESPALEVARALIAEVEGEVLACDPNLRVFEEFPLHSLEECLERADIVVALVAHREFRHLDSELLKDRVIIDACGVIR